MYTQVFDPVGGSLALSALFAALPLITLFVLLGGLRIAAWKAGIASLVVAVLVAILAWGMPVDQTLLVTAEGAVFGLFPIMWIVVNAIWIYNMTVKTGHFAILRRSFAAISDDKRIQAVIVSFCFGALIEGLAGFGTPVAITSVMLIALGFSPIKAAVLALVGNTAPVAFGSIGTPIITLGAITGLPVEDLGAMVGRQTPLLALFVPLILVFIVDGMRGVRQTWPAAMVAGFTFAVGQFVSSNYISVELTDLIGALLSTAALVLFLRVWHPSDPLLEDPDAHEAFAPGTGPPAVAGAEAHPSSGSMEADIRRRDQKNDTPREQFDAFLPYLIIVVAFALAKLFGPVKHALFSLSGGTDYGTDESKSFGFPWPGLNIVNPDGEAPSATTFGFSFFDTPGTIVLFCGILTIFLLKVGVGRALRAYGETLDQLKWAIVTVMAVLGLAYVMNLSGMTTSLGQFAALAGGFFAFLSPILGWLGVAITGSDTSSNALFGTLQVAAAEDAGLSPLLMAASNSSGGVLGKMISPQNLAICAAAVGMAGREGDILRKCLGWTIGLTLVMCVLVVLQAGPLSFMVP